MRPGFFFFQGRCVKHNKQIADLEPESLTRAPHSFVFTRGTAGKYVYSLMKSFRKIMEPFTASQLRVCIKILLLICISMLKNTLPTAN